MVPANIRSSSAHDQGPVYLTSRLARWLRASRLFSSGALLAFAACGCQSSPVAGSGGLFGPTNATAPSQPSYVDQPVERISEKESTALTRLGYGQLMEQRNNIPEARKHYNSALQANPKLVAAHVGLARIDYTAGRFNEAKDRLQSVLKTSPNSGLALSAMAQFHAERGEWDDSLGYIQRAMDAEPDNKNYKFRMGVALAKSGRIEPSMPYFVQSVGAAAGHHNIGVILYEMGDLAGAEQHARAALQEDPNLADAQELLATIQNPGQLTAGAGLENRRVPAQQVAGPAIRPGKSTVQSSATARRTPALPISSGRQHINVQGQQAAGQPTVSAPRIRIRPSVNSSAAGTDLATNWGENNVPPQPPVLGADGPWQRMPTAPVNSRSSHGSAWEPGSSSSRN